jgi:hypothetical protein
MFCRHLLLPVSFEDKNLLHPSGACKIISVYPLIKSKECCTQYFTKSICNSITQFKCCSVQRKLFSFMLFPVLSFILITTKKIPTVCSEVSTDLYLFSLSIFLVCNYLNINVTMSCTLRVYEVRFLGGVCRISESFVRGPGSLRTRSGDSHGRQ